MNSQWWINRRNSKVIMSVQTQLSRLSRLNHNLVSNSSVHRYNYSLNQLFHLCSNANSGNTASCRNYSTLPLNQYKSVPYHVHCTRNIVLNGRAQQFSTASAASPEESFAGAANSPHREASEAQIASRVTLAEQIHALETVPQSNVRNFSIIAHIDHGKSTLADRLLELAGNINLLQKNEAQVLDNLQVERDRGITVKAQTATMFYRSPLDQNIYIFNLIDTPGHVDFSYEVSRALAACEGVLLLVDATQGIQAQTLANYYTAKNAGLDVIPIISKMDLPHAQPKLIAQQIESALGIAQDRIIYISSKTGQNVESIFPAIIDRIKPPRGQTEPSSPLRGLIFDNWFTLHRGVVCLLSVRDGEVRKGDKIGFFHASLAAEASASSTSTQNQYDIIELGLLQPKSLPVESLRAGQVGYMIAGIKTAQEVKLGDTVFKISSKKSLLHSKVSLASARNSIVPLEGFKPSKSFVFAGIFPTDSGSFEALSSAIAKLTLNDASVQLEKESSTSLGLGFRCGFLGILHMDVFVTRLHTEFDVEVIQTAATVPFLAQKRDGTSVKIDNPAKFPPENEVEQYLEPFVLANIITPAEYLGGIMELIQSNRGETLDLTEIGDRTQIRCKLPLAEIVLEFYDQLKSITSGYASFDYEEAPYERADLVKLDIKINGNGVEELSVISSREKAEPIGRRMIHKLRENIDRQAFEIIIQAAIGTKVIARDRLAPLRKDVLTKSGKTVGGGDVTRKNKLLQKQKEGKKRMKTVGTVELSQEVFTAVMKLK
jgi:elongation factor 4